MKIDRVEVRIVAPEVQRWTWSHDLPEQYMTCTIVRVFTDEGLEGVGAVSNYTSHHFDRYTGETMRHLIPELIGRDPLQRETIWKSLWPRVFPLSPQALAGIDIALWDLFGRLCKQPLYQILGGARDRIESYASTPMFEDVPTYLKFIQESLDQGFHAVKFHCWCDPPRDLELVRAARKEFPDTAFMLDVENNYDRENAYRVAKELEELEFTWFEAPLFDYDLDGYRELTRRCSVPIIPSGNWIQDLQGFGEAIRTKAWSRARTDVTVCGGYTAARKAMALVDASEMKCEIMSWGNTLISAANLHLMLAFNSCSYYEQPVPYPSYEYGMKDVLRTGPDGFVSAPQGPGLGVEIDWPAMEAATIHTITAE